VSLTIAILGCGSSGGVPRVGSGWGACDPHEPRNRRRRCSILVERHDPGTAAATRVLVDTSPDLREQLLDAGVSRLDGVLYTHEHADHTHGIDDLRPLAIHMRRRIDVWMDAPTSAAVRRRFAYCFESPPGSEYPPILTEHRIVPGESVTIDGPGGRIEALPFLVRHGGIDALGFRFGDLAYLPDVNAIPHEAVPAMTGLDVLILDALRPARHPSHFSVGEALDWIGRLKPRRAFLTNLHTDLDYRTLSANLPEGVVAVHDGMRINS
jgi:phosphoribosyl 1,2-cyclic phosphate phosphodiesterase